MTKSDPFGYFVGLIPVISGLVPFGRFRGLILVIIALEGLAPQNYQKALLVAQGQFSVIFWRFWGAQGAILGPLRP